METNASADPARLQEATESAGHVQDAISKAECCTGVARKVAGDEGTVIGASATSKLQRLKMVEDTGVEPVTSRLPATPIRLRETATAYGYYTSLLQSLQASYQISADFAPFRINDTLSWRRTGHDVHHVSADIRQRLSSSCGWLIAKENAPNPDRLVQDVRKSISKFLRTGVEKQRRTAADGINAGFLSRMPGPFLCPPAGSIGARRRLLQ